MIICTKNNFGGGEICFKGYTSPSLCILNGVFTVDPDSVDYQAVSRLEISLPEGFPMKRSQTSSAILISGTSELGVGTPIKCHIEDYKICLEMLSIYDSYGPMTIMIASAFVTGGYRGSFVDGENTDLFFKKVLSTEYVYSLVKDTHVSLSAVFDKFPWPSDWSGPVSIPIDGLPADIDVEIPICVQGNYDEDKPGSYILRARIQNGHLHYVMTKDALSVGGEGCFTTIFATRGTYTPSEPVAGGFHGAEGELKDDVNTETATFTFYSNAGLGALAINVDCKTTHESNPFLMTRKNISDSHPYSALALVIGRAKTEENYRLTPCEFSWSKFHKAQTFEFLIDNANIKLDNSFFGTYPYHTITF